MNLTDITAHWVALHETLGLGGAVRDEAHYHQLMEVAESLMDDAPACTRGPTAVPRQVGWCF
jgi:HTH-type transcriptional regulator/antitoxin HigA